ncbi:DUF2002 family protein [Pseudomonas sp. Irchel s3f19]|uniref:DUF2002 family protein n=1 Tax=Pseudomonas TaxID=286 RepID=UPI000BA498E8|nr:DUF2002 family protein [Pseudomonas sp. Irchel s3f19]
MTLKPLQINMLLENIGFSLVSHNNKKYIWRHNDGEFLFVNMKNLSGKSALVIEPSWMNRISELRIIQGVVPGADYVHHSNMNVFPKHLNGGIKPIHYGLPVTLETENALLGLLSVLYPSFDTERLSNTATTTSNHKILKKSGPSSHYELLSWFEQYAGQELTWNQLQKAPSTVAISAKGIFKPEGLDYALSISQRLDSPYSDRAPEYQYDGSWRYSYAQEESKRGDATSLFTNQGLKKCMDDGVPVAVLVQLSKKPNVTRYRLLGLAKVVAWENKVFTLESTTLTEALIRTNQKLDDSPPYSPAGIEDNRKRILREITERQGQGAFRSGLLTAYEGRCAITDCTVTQVLEAAHITPYLGPETNNISNGLLLRSDLHTLWDKGLIYLCDHFTLELKSSLLNSEYSSLAGKRIRATTGGAPGISLDAVRAHREWCCKNDRGHQ